MSDRRPSAGKKTGQGSGSKKVGEARKVEETKRAEPMKKAGVTKKAGAKKAGVTRKVGAKKVGARKVGAKKVGVARKVGATKKSGPAKKAEASKTVEPTDMAEPAKTTESTGGSASAKQAESPRGPEAANETASPQPSRPEKQAKQEKQARKKEEKQAQKKQEKQEKREREEKRARPPKKISNKRYERALARQQVELVKLQEWVKQTGRRVVIVFEGRDAAGKGGTIKRITEPLNPRGCQVVALPAPTEREKTQWYFQRYVPHLPAAGEIVIFDRSWYNRAGVEHVMGFCSDEEYAEFMRTCPEFERMLVRSGIQVIKYWFSVGDDEQERRFRKRLDDPTTRWKLSPMDLESRARWADYSRAKDEMFAHTDIEEAPWNVVASDVKKHARLNCIAHLLSQVPYEDLTPKPIKLGKRPPKESYERPPMDTQTFVPEIQDKV